MSHCVRVCVLCEGVYSVRMCVLCVGTRTGGGVSLSTPNIPPPPRKELPPTPIDNIGGQGSAVAPDGEYIVLLKNILKIVFLTVHNKKL